MRPNPSLRTSPETQADFRTMMQLLHRLAVVMVVAWSSFAREG